MRAIPCTIIILLFVDAALHAAEPVFPGEDWPTAKPAEVGVDEALLKQAREYALSGGGSGYVTRGGKLVMAWGDVKRRYDLKSTTKSIGVTALGLAIADGKIKLNDLAKKHHPTFGTPPEANAKNGWIDEITIFHLATQTAGFEKPGGYTRIVSRPGTEWSYSDGGPNWLAECISLTYKRDLNDVLFERVFTPLGIGKDDLTWRSNAYRPRQIEGVARREFGSGISANVDAMARIGYLYLREGRWRDKQIIPADFVKLARRPQEGVVGLPERDAKQHGNASDHYGLLWWNNADGTLKDVPRDAYWSWGLYDSLILVIPSLDIVVARAGKSWQRKWDGHYDVLKPFFAPIVKSVRDDEKPDDKKQSARVGRQPDESAPVFARDIDPPQIVGIQWAPASTILRRARGSDNWPLTWGDDGHLYTAFGDGWGFEPRAERKLSLGLARVTGEANDFRGENIRSKTGQQLGDGVGGKKASGLLMVEGVLYMLVRNAGNSQLAWSADRGKTWAWSDWRFQTSFGCPTFLNFGRNYAGARDDYVYIVSFDNDSAYKPADRFVMARALKTKLQHRDAYEFFAGRDESNRPRWSKSIDDRAAVMTRQGGCYRGGISYNAPLRQYLWAQILPGGDTRFAGGLAILTAPQPWGPWREIYVAEKRDVAPGESASFPTKWISEDGRTAHLVFSGEDCFSVRGATVVLQ